MIRSNRLSISDWPIAECQKSNQHVGLPLFLVIGIVKAQFVGLNPTEIVIAAQKATLLFMTIA